MSTAPELDALAEDTIQRWKAAFLRIAEAQQATATGGAKFVKSANFAFDLSNYTPERFPPSVRWKDEIPSDSPHYVYFLNDENQPTHYVAYRDGRMEECGIYTYDPHEAEMIGFSTRTGVPWIYKRMTFSAGIETTRQELIVNCGGYWPALADGSVADRIAEILNNPRNCYCLVRDYTVRDKRTFSGRELRMGLGYDGDFTPIEYTYDASGELERVVQIWPQGKQVLFAKRSALTTSKLTELLAARITDHVIDALHQQRPGEQLSAVELNYRAGDSLAMVAVPLWENQKIASLQLILEVPQAQWAQLPEDKLGDEGATLSARLAKSEQWTPVKKMMRLASKLIMERAGRRLALSPEFIAYAIDWEVEGEQLKKVLTACGVSKDLLMAWKQKGLLK